MTVDIELGGKKKRMQIKSLLIISPFVLIFSIVSLGHFAAVSCKC